MMASCAVLSRSRCAITAGRLDIFAARQAKFQPRQQLRECGLVLVGALDSLDARRRPRPLRHDGRAAHARHLCCTWRGRQIRAVLRTVTAAAAQCVHAGSCSADGRASWMTALLAWGCEMPCGVRSVTSSGSSSVRSISLLRAAPSISGCMR